MQRAIWSGVALTALIVATVPAADNSATTALFNGKDLTNFYTYLQKSGKNNDPKKVFTVVQEDGAPAIRVSGEEFGCFITEKEYSDYHLVAEFKWGKETFAPRKEKTRDSGILFHCIGVDGGSSGTGTIDDPKPTGPWLESIEYQMIEGGTGDFIVVGGIGKRPRITCNVEKRDGGTYFARTGGMPMEFAGGRVNWWGRDPSWKDDLGFRGKEDVEKPVGEWNTAEIICDGDNVTSILNGVIVNKATKVTPTKGKILFQSEGAEVFFRKIDLKPVK
jgi:hypothetical protein